MHHLMGSAEVAGRLGLTRQRIGQLAAAYDDWPAPVAVLASGKVWDAADIEGWLERHPERPGGRRRAKAGGHG
jgi:prophage regulatory protein